MSERFQQVAKKVLAHDDAQRARILELEALIQADRALLADLLRHFIDSKDTRIFDGIMKRISHIDNTLRKTTRA